MYYTRVIINVLRITTTPFGENQCLEVPKRESVQQSILMSPDKLRKFHLLRKAGSSRQIKLSDDSFIIKESLFMFSQSQTWNNCLRKALPLEVKKHK